ncbi:hypothetical protein SNE40_014354 [Patella caerulea]|uniref:Uncharacterized protein n=1 Tax=Patella caerulea TaxID=87958 RepID=A0AAN8JEE2_PATCE
MNEDDSNLSESCCVMCEEGFTHEKATKLYKKGRGTLFRLAELRGDLTLQQRLLTEGNLYVHESCRRPYIDERTSTCSTDDSGEPRPKKLRSEVPQFEWKVHCFLCGEPAISEARHPDRDRIKLVETMEIRTTSLKASERVSSSLTDEIRARLLDCHDLVAVEARYHSRCYQKLLLANQSVNSDKAGRPVDENKQDSFLLLCSWLESEGDAEIFSIKELHRQMGELACEGSEIYSEKALRMKLKSHYGEHIYFAYIGGSREEVVCFRNMASFIISDSWYQERKANQLEDSERIMVAAAKLIREEIRQREYTKREYPNPYDLNDYDSLCEFLTPSLLKLLQTLMKNDLKMVSIGHAIVQCVRPRSVISPIMFGLGAEMDLVFGSRWLNEELYALGFSVSYDEVQTFKHSILQDPTLNCLSAAEKCPTHYVADNADSNVSTLDGKGTFHGLGLIRITKKKNRVDSVSERVKRLARVHVNELVKDRGIPVLSYVPCGPPALASVKFNPLIELKYPTTGLPILYYSNLLWQSSYLLKKSLSPEPHWLNWSGFMQHAFLRHDTVDEDDITILPLMDLDPGDMSTLYSCIST